MNKAKRQGAHLPEMKWLGLLVLVALDGCAEPPDPRCSEEVSSSFEPRGGEPAWVLPSTPFVRPEGSALATHLWLPWDYNQRAAYPVDEGDPVRFRMRLAAGSESPATVASLVVYVEGRASEVLFDDRRELTYDVLLSGGLGEVWITIPPTLLAPGLNNVHVVHSIVLQNESQLTSTSAFSIANGSFEPQVYVEPSGLTDGWEGDAHNSDLSYWHEGAGQWRVLFGITGSNLPRGVDPLRVRLRMQRHSFSCPAETDTFAVVALRDGVPVPVADFDRLLVALASGDRREVEYDVPLWPDDNLHRYTLLSLHGFGHPTATGNGTRSRWNFPNLYPVGLIRWTGWPAE